MEHMTSYRTYFVLWVVLLMLTLTMIFAEGAGFPRAAAVIIVLGAMTTKVVLIGGWYMHLRQERLSLIVAVVLGTFATAAVLFGLLAPESISVLHSRP